MKHTDTGSELSYGCCGQCGEPIGFAWRHCAHCGEMFGSGLSRWRGWTEVGLALAVVVALMRSGSGSGQVVTLRESLPTAHASFSVPADHWVDTGVNVPPGGSIRIKAAGAWNGWKSHETDMGPEGFSRSGSYDTICPVANWCALIGRIGNGPYFAIGADATVSSTQGGELVLGINDDCDSGATGDNTGSMDVTVSGAGTSTLDAHDIPVPRR